MPSLLDELDLSPNNLSLNEEFGLDETVNILPKSIQEWMEYSAKNPTAKLLQAIGATLKKPVASLEKKLRGKGFEGEPQTTKEGLAQLRFNSPYLYPLAKAAAKSPDFSKKLQSFKPYAETGQRISEDYLKLPEFGAGALQSLADVPISVANLGLNPAGLGIPHPDFRGMLNKPASLAGEVAGIAGQLTGGLPLYSKGFGAASTGPKVPGYGGQLDAIGRGAVTGYAMGETGEEGEGRVLGGLLGGALAPFEFLNKSRVGAKFGEDTKKLQKKFNVKYDNIFNTAKKAGAQYIRPPQNVDYALLRKHLDRDGKIALDRFLSNSTLKHAQEFQTELGRFGETVKKARKIQGKVSGVTGEAEEAASKLQKKLRGTIYQNLESVEPKLGQEYLKTTKQYGEQVGPRLTGGYQQYKAGGKGSKLTDSLIKDFDNAIKTDPKRVQVLLKQYPELKMLAAVDPYLSALKRMGINVGLPFAAGGAGAAAAMKYGLGEIFSSNSDEHE